MDKSFNKVTVDSDTSTNDTCFLLASGAAAPDAAPIAQGSVAYDELAQAIGKVCETLARKIASDGEGATRLVTVTVEGAADEAQADLAARAIATASANSSADKNSDRAVTAAAFSPSARTAAFAKVELSTPPESATTRLPQAFSRPINARSFSSTIHPPFRVH